jgi:O-antigen/teichoic acid export membrane protein
VSTASSFGARITGVFLTRIALFSIGIISSFLLARLLGPAGRGAYSVVLLVPSTLAALGQLGIPSALTYLSGRGRSLSNLLPQAFWLAAALSIVTVGAVLLVLGPLERTVLRAAPAHLVLISLLTIPIAFVGTFLSAIVLGRQRIRSFSLIQLAQSALSLVLLVVLIGILGLGLDGAVAAAITSGIVAAIAYFVVARRLQEPGSSAEVRVWEVLSYGIRVYPASVTAFFGYRADVFLLSWLLGSPTQIGLYGVAVSLAELVFYVPDSVSTVFFPKVANAERADADRLVAPVNRLNLLITAGAALAMVPLGTIVVWVLLPSFAPGLAALYILLPGVVALSMSKVLSGYVTGVGRPLSTGAVSTATLIANLIANLILIPIAGIEGAAASSLLSYSMHASLMLLVASRASGEPISAFILPQRSDVAVLVDRTRMLATLLLRPRTEPSSSGPDDRP